MEDCYCLQCALIFSPLLIVLFNSAVPFSFPDLFPVPALLTLTAEKFFLTDIDSNRTTWQHSAEANIKDICYTADDDTVYYIVEDSLLMQNTQVPSESQVLLCSFPCLRELRKWCGCYWRYFGVNDAFKEVKAAPPRPHPDCCNPPGVLHPLLMLPE